jgi:hypothetical protein
VVEERAAEYAALTPWAPRSGVEKTPVGSAAELAVENVLVETQNEESVAAVSPFVPLSVALFGVTAVAALVVGAVAANADGAITPNAKPNVPTMSARDATTDRKLLMPFKVLFFIMRIIFLVNPERI